MGALGQAAPSHDLTDDIHHLIGDPRGIEPFGIRSQHDIVLLLRRGIAVEQRARPVDAVGVGGRAGGARADGEVSARLAKGLQALQGGVLDLLADVGIAPVVGAAVLTGIVVGDVAGHDARAVVERGDQPGLVAQHRLVVEDRLRPDVRAPQLVEDAVACNDLIVGELLLLDPALRPVQVAELEHRLFEYQDLGEAQAVVAGEETQLSLDGRGAAGAGVT